MPMVIAAHESQSRVVLCVIQGIFDSSTKPSSWREWVCNQCYFALIVDAQLIGRQGMSMQHMPLQLFGIEYLDILNSSAVVLSVCWRWPLWQQ